ncbi:MAG: endonuclease III [Lautropia sp.]|nr:MAG: endonuclease III [Lautropia sp.]
MSPKHRLEMFRRLAAANPEPETELEYGSPYQLLAAVLMSAQATDKSVNLVTRRLFPLAPTPQAMVGLGLERITDTIRTIGLFRNKAKNLLTMSQILIDQHGGEVPDNREALEALPGVGRKTANVILNVAFGHPTIAVDTHIFRVSNRTGLAPGRNVDEVEQKLLKVVPKEYRLHAHHWLILHGRYICKARTPECWRCPISDLCAFEPKTLPPPYSPGQGRDAPLPH